MFAGSANGNVAPIRAIKGQATLLARTIHHLAVDTVHDELVVPNPFAEAILFFKGGADGEEPPIRIIQGPKTKLRWTDNVEVDPIHNEVFTTQRLTNSILVFDRDASGDVEPIRIIHGPKTRLNTPARVKVDPINNLLVVGNYSKTGTRGVLIFNRTDHGDVAPRAIISGPKTGMNKGGVKRFAIYPEGRTIFALIKQVKEAGDGFVGVWSYDDNGDVPPLAMIKASPTTQIETPGGIALNPEDNEVIIDGGGSPPKVLVFHAPELFN